MNTVHMFFLFCNVKCSDVRHRDTVALNVKYVQQEFTQELHKAT